MATIQVGPKKEKKKEPEKPKAPAKPDVEVFRSKGGGTTGFTTPKGQTFLGRISPQEEAGIQQKFAPEQARLAQREALIQQEQRMEGAAGTLQEAGAFEEVTPRETELSPDLKTDIPVLTPTLGAASQIAAPRGLLGIARDKGWLGNLLPKVKTGEEAFPIPETPETLREAALRQIQINAFNEDTTRAEKFGATMELFPGFGAIDQWVKGVVESPHENAIAVRDEAVKIGETATNNQEKTKSGIMPAAFAMARARQMEEEIAQLEGRLKLLINQSKILQANRDEVNKMETVILDAKIRTDNFRTAASYALTAEITGTGRVVPTDEQLYFELKEGR